MTKLMFLVSVFLSQTVFANSTNSSAELAALSKAKPPHFSQIALAKTKTKALSHTALASAPAPTVSLTASSTSTAYNGSTTLTWISSNANTCTVNGSWFANNGSPPDQNLSSASIPVLFAYYATSGSQTLNGLSTTYDYTITCTGSGGTSSSTVTVSVSPPPPPTVSLSSNQALVAYNGSAVLSWTASNAAFCLASGGWSDTFNTSGSYTTPALMATTAFNLTCRGPGGTASQSVTVAVSSAPSSAGSLLGINLSEVNDWNDHQLTFVDVMKQARGFANLNNPWDPTTTPVPLDANGWPTTDFGVYFITTIPDPLNRPLSTTYPSMFGTYNLSFNGQANIGSLGSNQILNQVYNSATNTTTAQVIVGTGNSQLDLEFTNTHGGVQNLQLLRPGYPLGSTQVFTNQFLQALAPFSTLRFMEFLMTNGNSVTTWAGRKQVNDPTQQDPKGVAWEYLIQLANATNKDIWINIPQGIDLTDTTANNYVTQLAELLKTSLNPGLHVYVEYSNELWNTQFTQSTANYNAAVAAVNAGTDSTLNYDNINNPWYWSYRLAAHQTIRISQLFANIYGSSAINTTIRPVYASQEVQPFLMEDSLSYIQKNFGNPSQYLYAIGGAPYFTAGSSDTTLAGLFSNLQTSLNNYLPGFSAQPAYNGGIVYTGVTLQSLANYYGLQRVAYEGGPDLSAETNYVLVEQAEGDPRLNQLTQTELANFYGCQNSLFVYYKLAAPSGSGSAFGAYEDITVPTEKSTALTAVAATPLANYNTCLSSVSIASSIKATPKSYHGSVLNKLLLRGHHAF
jgi:hypothetical protein